MLIGRSQTVSLVAEQPVRGFGTAGLRRDGVFIAVLVAITILSWLPLRHGPIDLRWDAGVYYTLGTSLAQGHGYRLLNEPGDAWAVQYPPLVPAIISAVEVLARTDDPSVIGSLMKLAWLAMFLVFVAGVYIMLRGFLPRAWAFAGALLCILNFEFYFYANLGGSELPFALLGVAFLLALRLPNGRKQELAAAAAGAGAFLARNIGIALLGAWILDGILRRRFRLAAGRSVLAAACLLAWTGYIHWVESSPAYFRPAYPYQRAGYLFYNVSYLRNVSYKDPFRPESGKVGLRDIVERITTNAAAVPEKLGSTITAAAEFWEIGRLAIGRFTGIAIVPSLLLMAIRIGLGILTLAGLALLLVRLQWFVPLYVIATILVICSAPWPTQMLRYLEPILPFLLLAFLTAVLALQSYLLKSRPVWLVRVGPALAVGAILALQIGSYIVSHTIHFQLATYRTRSGAAVAYHQLWYRAPDQGLDEAIDWIQAHAQPGDVVASSMPHWIYLRTKLKAVMPPFEWDPRQAQQLLDSVPVRYLVEEDRETLTNFTARYMDRMLTVFPDRWRLVHVSPGNFAKVYERAASREFAR
jgi:hypothetical protein